MPRIDGLPAADALEGSEPFAMMQGGVTKNATPKQLLEFVVAKISAGGSIGTGAGAGTGTTTPPSTTAPSKVTFDQDGTAARTITFDQA